MQTPQQRFFMPEFKLGQRVAIIRTRHGWFDGSVQGTITQISANRCVVTDEMGGEYEIERPRDIYLCSDQTVPKMELEKLSNYDLATVIFKFLDQHAKTKADFDPLTDPKSERFNGPDSAALYSAAECLQTGKPYNHVWSDWGQGCYTPITDSAAMDKHDELVRLVNKKRKLK